MKHCPRCAQPLSEHTKINPGGDLLITTALCSSCLFRETSQAPNPRFQAVVFDKRVDQDYQRKRRQAREDRDRRDKSIDAIKTFELTSNQDAEEKSGDSN